jgi:hypothetical protein
VPRTRFSVPLVLLCVLALAACSENPNDVKLAAGRNSAVISPTETLDQGITGLLALFPKNLDERNVDAEGADLNPRATWDQIKKKYATGQTKPAHMVIAKRKLVALSDWVARNSAMMSPPPSNETRTSAGARLVLYMSLYVYGGPTTPAPSYNPGADATAGVVTPGAPATIVTPTLHAGVQLEAGSVAENTVIVVTQNPTPYPDNCSGPLQTRLCQYPQFYTFEMFPHKRLLKAGKFNVCHINSGDKRRPLADHDRFRLAHALPADPANYTPGSTIRDQNGESIEILQMVPQTFSTCIANVYASNNAVGVLTRFAKGLQSLISPKSAYAVDVGLGGLSFDMSPFNDVDPAGVPDRAVQWLSVSPTCGAECPIRPGAQITVRYVVKNMGTASGAGVPVVIRLISVPTNPEDPGVPLMVNLATGSIPTLAPGDTVFASTSVTIPATVSGGPYNVALLVGDDPAFPESIPSLANNDAALRVAIIGGPPLVRFCSTTNAEGPPTFSDLRVAIDQVAPGGIVEVCDGTYAINGIDIGTKSMTIEGEGPGVPTFDGAGGGQVFYMDSPFPVTTATVLRRLRLRNGQYGNLSVQHFYGSLLIDQVEFHPPHGVFDPQSGLGYGSGVGVYTATGNGVTVQNSTFDGGDIGVHEHNSLGIFVSQSTFANHSNAAIHGDGGSILALNNTITNCGPRWCVGLFNGSGQGNYSLRGNSVTVDFSKRIENAIQVHGAIIELRENSITGTGGTRDPLIQSSWPMARAITVNDGSSATVRGNRVTGAHTAFDFANGTTGGGFDNVANGVSIAMSFNNAGAVSINRSDFTGFNTPLSVFQSPNVDARCNWWGSAGGPGETFVDSTVYTPWSVLPIANQEGVSCIP